MPRTANLIWRSRTDVDERLKGVPDRLLEHAHEKLLANYEKVVILAKSREDEVSTFVA